MFEDIWVGISIFSWVAVIALEIWLHHHYQKGLVTSALDWLRKLFRR